MELDIAMDDSLAVAVVEGLGQLEHDLGNLLLRHLSVLEALPILVELTSSQVLHHDDQLAFLGFRDGVKKLNNVLVAESTKSFNLLFYHLVANLSMR